MALLYPARRWSDVSLNTFDDFDSLFDAFLGTKSSTRENTNTIPRANIQEHSEGYTIKIAAPGFSKSDFKIQADSGYLTVSAKSETHDSNEKYTSTEFSYGEFTRTWKIPQSVNTTGLTARYEAGILSVSLPTSNKKNDRVEVEVE